MAYCSGTLEPHEPDEATTASINCSMNNPLHSTGSGTRQLKLVRTLGSSTHWNDTSTTPWSPCSSSRSLIKHFQVNRNIKFSADFVGKPPMTKKHKLNTCCSSFIIIARHRLNINTEFRPRLTTRHNNPLCLWSLPTSTNRKDEILVELPLMQEVKVIYKPLSNYFSPISGQR